MSSRLSPEALLKSYDGGFRSFDWGSKFSNVSFLTAPAVDLNELLQGKQAKKRVQQVDPLKLFNAVVENGPSESLEILNLMSDEQLTRFLDYDGWNENRLDHKKIFEWISLYGEIDSSLYYKRYKGLEEEYQIALLSSFLKVYEPEEFEDLSDAEQDSLYAFPGDAFYYKITTEDDTVVKFIQSLLDSCIAENMEYAISLVAHASFMPPNESEQTLAQFRMARNEEDGFVPYEDAVKAFLPIDTQKFESKANKYRESRSSLATVEDDFALKGFLAYVIDYGSKEVWTEKETGSIRDGFLYLANQLASVVGVEPGETRELKKLLEQAYSLNSFGLQVLSKNDSGVAAKILRDEYPKAIFRYSVSLVNELRGDMIAQLKDMNIPDVQTLENNLKYGRFGLCLDWLDKNLSVYVNLYFLETLKGLFNRFPLAPRNVATSSSSESDRVEFVSLGSLDDFQRLEQECSSIAQMLKLAFVANDGLLGEVDKVLTRAVGSVLLGGRFINRKFSLTMARDIVAMSAEQRSGKVDELIESLRNILNDDMFAVVMKSVAIEPARLHQRISEFLSGFALQIDLAANHDDGEGVELNKFFS